MHTAFSNHIVNVRLKKNEKATQLYRRTIFVLCFIESANVSGTEASAESLDQILDVIDNEKDLEGVTDANGVEDEAHDRNLMEDNALRTEL